MAADSLIGSVSTTLSDSAKALLDAVLADAANAVVSTVGSGGTLVVANAEGVAGLDMKQVAVVAGDAGLSNAAVNDGLVSMLVSAGVGATVTNEGTATEVTVNQATEYLNALIDAAIPADSANPAVLSARQSLQDTVDLAVAAGGENMAVRVMQIDAATAASGTLTLDYSGNDANVVQAIVANGADLVVSGVSSVAMLGSGSISVAGNEAATVVADSASQEIRGGAGADTLIGGGGNDTIIGGAGDTIGINGVGDMTFGGLENGATLNFMFDGITSLDQLASLVTGADESESGVTYHFGEGVSITLTGINASELTADMIHFNA